MSLIIVQEFAIYLLFLSIIAFLVRLNKVCTFSCLKECYKKSGHLF